MKLLLTLILALFSITALAEETVANESMACPSPLASPDGYTPGDLGACYPKGTGSGNVDYKNDRMGEQYVSGIDHRTVKPGPSSSAPSKDAEGTR